ncbi:hypothetical protein HMPREF0742_02474 [Rothia aeria F0184]|uniref:Uncharacterized protein n=1 Tax=Rothia aeria F0184 TaxID=888019 RepID=U7UYW2_9MICC|nr:hypothetical protein HMPREF0742_02474 [Rothia aeria F0184]
MGGDGKPLSFLACDGTGLKMHNQKTRDAQTGASRVFLGSIS